MDRIKVTKQKVKTSGSSSSDLNKVNIKEFANKFAKMELPSAEELQKVLDAFPLSYLDLKSKAIQEMIMFSNEALRRKDVNEEEFSDPEANQRQFLEQEALAWNELKVLRDDSAFNPKTHKIDSNSVATSLLRLRLIENMWPKDKMSASQLKNIKTAQILLTKLNKLTYADAVSMGFGKAGGKVTPQLKDIDTLIKLAEADHTMQLTTVRESYVDMVQSSAKITLEWENLALGKFKGKLSGLISRQIDSMLKEETKKTKTVFEKMNIANISGSPTFLHDVETALTTAMLGKKVPIRKRKTVSKTQYKLLKTQKVKSAKRKLSSKVLPKLPTFKEIGAGAELPLFSIMALINEALSEQIKDNMGSPNDPPVLLRNQTGRFAESARMLTLTKAQTGILVGTYTYQRKPYDVFLPTGKLGTPKRNPKVYVEGSIRELALAIMKRKFPGLALELV